jgi:hypothetical protein
MIMDVFFDEPHNHHLVVDPQVAMGFNTKTVY